MKIEYRSDELYHHGVLGMKWGKRKAQKRADKEYRKQLLNSIKNDKGPKRGKVLNASNSAARSFYRSERTGNFKTYRSQKSKATLKEARLTSDQVKAGRYRVAKARSIKRNAASVALGALSGAGALAAVAASGGTAIPLILATAGSAGIGTLGAHFGTGAHYYGKQRKAYGSTRVKYQTQINK